MPYGELSATLETINAIRASPTTKLTLRFLILTATRTSEILGATWDEIDAKVRVWPIAGQRMKSGTEHRVPFSMPAFDVLERAEALDDGSGLVFPSSFRRWRKMSNMTLTNVLRDTGLAKRSTVHGFHGSFRDWCADTGKPREVATVVLAHTVGGVAGGYFRSDLFEHRRRLMDSWAAYFTGYDAKVVTLHR